MKKIILVMSFLVTGFLCAGKTKGRNKNSTVVKKKPKKTKREMRQELRRQQIRLLKLENERVEKMSEEYQGLLLKSYRNPLNRTEEARKVFLRAAIKKIRPFS